MRINKKTLILITCLVFLLIILLVLKFTLGKKSSLPPSQIETTTPAPTIISPTPIVCPLNENIRGKLPYVTKNYTIEYLPVPQKFFVMILRKPFERYKIEAEKWFTAYGIDPTGTCISWASPKVP